MTTELMEELQCWWHKILVQTSHHWQRPAFGNVNCSLVIQNSDTPSEISASATVVKVATQHIFDI